MGQVPAEKPIDSRMREIKVSSSGLSRLRNPSASGKVPAKLSIRAAAGSRAKNRGPLRVGEDLRRASPRGGKTRKSRNLEALPAHPLFG